MEQKVRVAIVEATGCTGAELIRLLREHPRADTDALGARGSNRCFVSYTVDERTGRVIARAAIDDLVKGASGPTVQCFGMREGLGLTQEGLFP